MQLVSGMDLVCGIKLHGETKRNSIAVKDFRKWQRLVQEAEEEHASIQREFAQMDRQRSIKIKRATQQRNKKIVSLVQLRKQIAEVS